jgi:hypothetical protein
MHQADGKDRKSESGFLQLVFFDIGKRKVGAIVYWLGWCAGMNGDAG